MIQSHLVRGISLPDLMKIKKAITFPTTAKEKYRAIYYECSWRPREFNQISDSTSQIIKSMSECKSFYLKVLKARFFKRN